MSIILKRKVNLDNFNCTPPLEIGNLIKHKNLGVCVIVEKIERDNDRPWILGRPLFRIEKLFSDIENHYLIYENRLNLIKPVTDEDIEEGMMNTMCNFSLSESVQINIYPDEKALSISRKHAEDWIYLDLKEIQALKEALQELTI